jgi:hypothetical protein
MYGESNFNKGCVTIVALPFTLNKVSLRQKEEELWKTQILFHHAKNIIFKKLL